MRRISEFEYIELYADEKYGIYSESETRIGNCKEVLIEGRAGWFLVSADMFERENFVVRPSKKLLLSIGGLPEKRWTLN